MAEPADDVDAQDLAEVFDEDNLDTDRRRLRFADEELDADDLPDVLDVTRALGDEDEDEAAIGEELDDEEIVALGRAEEDEEDAFGDEDEETDEVQGPVGEDDEDEDEGFEEDMTGGRGGGGDEVGLRYVGDVSRRLGAHSAAQRYESRNLDDDDLSALGYGPDAAAAPPHSRAQGGAPLTPSEEAAERRLDEGIEETFPASDPVSVKHVS